MNRTESAAMRASIHAWLNQNRGPQTVEAVAAAFQISPKTAGQLLSRMAKAGLIADAPKQGTSKAYEWSDPKPAKAPAKAPAAPTPRAIGKGAGMELHVAGCVLTVLGNVSVTVGKNDATGNVIVVLEPR
jgi:DNA-binding transcriptional ArsR family regulator